MSVTSPSGENALLSREGFSDPSVLQHLEDLTNEQNMSADCWGSSYPMLIESGVWVLAGAVLWLMTLIFAAKGF